MTKIPALARLSGWLQGLLLLLAVALLFVVDDLQLSSACVLLWMLLALIEQAKARPWSLAILGIVALSVRPLILDEGPLPSSHTDYVLMVAAFLCGYGRGPRWWLRCGSVVALATLIGVVLNLEVVGDFARFGIEYHLPPLTKNQTGLLAGFSSLTALISLLASHRWRGRLVFSLALAAGLLLLAASDSRGGIVMLVMGCLLAALLLFRAELLARLRRLLGTPAWLRIGLAIALAAVLLTGWVSWHGLQDPRGLQTRLADVYGEENLENDSSRLRVYQCYLGLPFTGNNRFIWGIGYGNAMKRGCGAPEIGRSLSHSHNLLLQVWAETGISGALFALGSLGWILARIVVNTRGVVSGSARLMLFGSSAYVFYLLLFNMIELGMVKVPLLMFLFGLFLAAPFHRIPERANGAQSVT